MRAGVGLISNTLLLQTSNTFSPLLDFLAYWYIIGELVQKAGRAFGVIGMILGGLLLLLTIAFAVLTHPTKARKCRFLVCYSLCMLQAMLSPWLFVGLANEDWIVFNSK